MQEEDPRPNDPDCTMGSYWHHANPAPRTKPDGDGNMTCNLMGGSYRFDRQIPLMIYVPGTQKVAGLQGIGSWAHDNTNLYFEVLTENGVAAGAVKVNLTPSEDCQDLEFAKSNIPLCCEELYLNHHMNGRVDIKDYLSPTGISCCDSLKGIIPSSLYNEKCFDDRSKECDYTLNVQCLTDCEDINEGYVKDIGEDNSSKDWKCIFDSSNSSYSNIRNHYKWNGGGVGSNKYCEVYCREEIFYEFPRYGINVKAGHHFTVGERALNSWGPIEFTGLQECRTKGNGNKMIINHEQFTKDWEYYNKQLPKLWKEYQLEVARENSKEDAPEPSRDNCDYYCDLDEYYEVGKTTEKCCIETDKNRNDRCSDCYTGDPHEYMGLDEEGEPVYENTCKPGCDPIKCTKFEEKTPHGKLMIPPPRSHGVWGPEIAATWCTSNEVDKRYEPSYNSKLLEQDYIDSLEKRNMTLKTLEKCNDWKRGYNTFEPKVQLQYEEKKYGFNFDDFIGKLIPNLEKDEQKWRFYSDSDYKEIKAYKDSKKKEIAAWLCEEGEKCVNSPEIYPANDNREERYEKAYSYTLENDVYRFVTKPVGESMHKKPVNKDNEYVNMGYPNLPVHYSRLPGNYRIDLRYTSFGPDNKFNEYIFDGNLFAGKSYVCNNIYKCNYTVDNKFMYCDEIKCKDIQVIFRTISLSVPFPGKHGNIRNPGANWFHNVDKISKNRNLSIAERLYSDRDPMYEITLDSVTIGQIKKYNRNVPNGYSDFNLKCVIGEGRECNSNFIRKEFKSKFETKWCGMSTDFYKCEKDDKM